MEKISKDSVIVLKNGKGYHSFHKFGRSSPSKKRHSTKHYHLKKLGIKDGSCYSHIVDYILFRKYGY